MNKLWVRLSAAFSVILIVGMLSTLWVLFASNRESMVQSMLISSFQTSGGPVDRLRTYYVIRGSWRNVDRFIQEAIRLIGLDVFDALEVTFADENGIILFDNVEEREGMPLEDVRAVNVLPIMVDDVVRGYLRLRIDGDSVVRATFQNHAVEYFLQTLAIVVTIGGVFGITAGVIASRWLTAPLTRLSQTATAIRKGERERRAAERGTDEVRVLAQAFNTMIDSQQAGEKQRQQLVGDIAHELRTPLSVLQGNLYAMLEGVYPSDGAHVAGLYDQTRLLSRLVNDLHELSQAEAHKLPLDKQRLDPAASLEEILETFRPLAESKGVVLALDIAPDTPRLYADPGRFQQVIHNLLANALRYTPEGGRITLEARPHGADHVEIRVIDTGRGIAPEHLTHIFERFYRADPSRDRASGGAGLGLAIARAIVEAHDGTISAASEGIGKGTEIVVRLPAFAA